MLEDSKVSIMYRDNESEESARIVRAAPPAAPAVVAQTPKPKDPVIVSRTSINGGNNCPSGYTKQGTFCFPNTSDY